MLVTNVPTWGVVMLAAVGMFMIQVSIQVCGSLVGYKNSHRKISALCSRCSFMFQMFRMAQMPFCTVLATSPPSQGWALIFDYTWPISYPRANAINTQRAGSAHSHSPPRLFLHCLCIINYAS